MAYQDGANGITISTAPNTQTFLILYGSGLHLNNPQIPDYAYIGDEPVEIIYAGPQGQYTGLGQMTLKLPLSLCGRGTVTLIGAIDGQPFNALEIKLQ